MRGKHGKMDCMMRSVPPHVGLLPGEDRAGKGVVYVADILFVPPMNDDLCVVVGVRLCDRRDRLVFRLVCATLSKPSLK